MFQILSILLGAFLTYIMLLLSPKPRLRLPPLWQMISARKLLNIDHKAIRKHKFVDILDNPGSADLSAYVDYEAIRRSAEEVPAITNTYKTLRIRSGASEFEVKKAFRQLALQKAGLAKRRGEIGGGGNHA